MALEYHLHGLLRFLESSQILSLSQMPHLPHPCPCPVPPLRHMRKWVTGHHLSWKPHAMRLLSLPLAWVGVSLHHHFPPHSTFYSPNISSPQPKPPWSFCSLRAEARTWRREGAPSNTSSSGPSTTFLNARKSKSG